MCDARSSISNNQWRNFPVHIVAQLEKSSQINGVVVIMDFEGLGLKQIKAMGPLHTKRLLTFIQEAMPLRLKEIHFVKEPSIFKMVWAIFSPFVKEKLKKRVKSMSCLFWMFNEHCVTLLDVLPQIRHGQVPQVHSGWLLASQLWRNSANDRLLWQGLVSVRREISSILCWLGELWL